MWQRLAKDGAVEEGGNRDLGQWIVRALSVVAGKGRRQDGNEKLFYVRARIAVATLKLNRAIEKTPVACLLSWVMMF